jgi:integrase
MTKKRDPGSVRYHRGGWEIRLQVGGVRKTNRVKAPNTRAGRRTAEEALERLVRIAGLGCTGMTAGDMLDLYAERLSKEWKPSTRASFPHHLRPLVVGVGAIELAALQAGDIEAMARAWERSGIKRSTIRRRCNILGAALREAVRLGLIEESPWKRVRPLSIEALPPRDLPNGAKALAAIERLDHRRLQAVARLAAATGARRGELVALRWSDIDLDEGTVRFVQAISTDVGSRRIATTTKTGRTKTLALDEGAVGQLRQWRAEIAGEALHAGVRLRWVFPAPTDPREPWAPAHVTQAWARHREDIGLPDVRFHDLRHLHATELMAAGIDVNTVAARLGHSSPKMTLDVYGHASPARDRAAAEVIRRLRGPKPDDGPEIIALGG